RRGDAAAGDPPALPSRQGIALLEGGGGAEPVDLRLEAGEGSPPRDGQGTRQGGGGRALREGGRPLARARAHHHHREGLIPFTAPPGGGARPAGRGRPPSASARDRS